MVYEFDAPARRSGYGSVKWDFIEAKTGVPDALPMWIADMDFPSPPEVTEALVDRARYPFYGYTARPDSYYRAVTDWFLTRYGWPVDREWIVPSSGVMESITIAIRALSSRGDGVVIQTPVYHPFRTAIERTGRMVVENPLRFRGGEYAPDFDDLRRRLAIDKPKVFLLCNPHNPVGRVFTREELETLGNLCLEFGVTVISDEIHADITYPGNTHIPFTAASTDFSRNSIVCTAPGKTFSLAGLSVSNVVIADRTLRLWYERESEAVGAKGFNVFGAVACEAAYRHGIPWLDAALAYIRANRDYAIARLADSIPRAIVVLPEGTYFLWIDLSFLGLGAKELERFLLRDAKLWLNQGYIFGTGGTGFVRMNIACARPTLVEALDRLERAIGEFSRNGYDPGL